MHGINFLASYTLGHAIDHVSGLNIGGEQRPVLPVTIGDEASIDQALAFEKGDALFDVRHRFVVSFGAELPTPKQMGAIMEHVVGGWQVNGIVQAQTGFPTGVYDPTTDIRYLTNRPDVTCDPNANAPHTVDQWFDTSCFVRRAVPDTGTRPGNAGRNTVRGPGFARTDLSFFKNIDVRAATSDPAARRGVQPVQSDSLRPAGQPDRNGEFRAHHAARKMAGSFSSRRSTVSRGSRDRDQGSGGRRSAVGGRRLEVGGRDEVYLIARLRGIQAWVRRHQRSVSPRASLRGKRLVMRYLARAERGPHDCPSSLLKRPQPHPPKA